MKAKSNSDFGFHFGFGFDFRFLFLLSCWLLNIFTPLAAWPSASPWGYFPYPPPLAETDISAQQTYDLFNFPPELDIDPARLHAKLNKLYATMFRCQQRSGKPFDFVQLDGVLMGLLVASVKADDGFKETSQLYIPSDAAPSRQILMRKAQQGDFEITPDLRHGLWENIKLREKIIRQKEFPLTGVIAQDNDELIRKYITPPNTIPLFKELVSSLYGEDAFSAVPKPELTPAEILHRYYTRPFEPGPARLGFINYGEHPSLLWLATDRRQNDLAQDNLQFGQQIEQAEFELQQLRQQGQLNKAQLYKVLDQIVVKILGPAHETQFSNFGQEFSKHPALWRLRMRDLTHAAHHGRYFMQLFDEVNTASLEDWVNFAGDDPCPRQLLP